MVRAWTHQPSKYSRAGPLPGPCAMALTHMAMGLENKKALRINEHKSNNLKDRVLNY